MSRLAALLLLTAAFVPAAVLGAMPVVAPVVVICLAVALAMAAFEPVTPVVVETPSEAEPTT